MSTGPQSDLLSRLSRGTAATKVHTASTSPAVSKERSAKLKAAKAANERTAKAREKLVRQQAQLWLATQDRAVTRLQAAYRGRKGRSLARMQDEARPGVRMAVRLMEKLRVRMEHSRELAEEAAEAERERLKAEAAERRLAWQLACAAVKTKLREEKDRIAAAAAKLAEEEQKARRAAEEARVAGEEEKALTLEAAYHAAQLERRSHLRRTHDVAFEERDKRERKHTPAGFPLISLGASLTLEQVGYTRSFHVRLTLQMRKPVVKLALSCTATGYVKSNLSVVQQAFGRKMYSDEEAQMRSMSFVQPKKPTQMWSHIKQWRNTRKANAIVDLLKANSTDSSPSMGRESRPPPASPPELQVTQTGGHEVASSATAKTAKAQGKQLTPKNSSRGSIRGSKRRDEIPGRQRTSNSTAASRSTTKLVPAGQGHDPAAARNITPRRSPIKSAAK